MADSPAGRVLALLERVQTRPGLTAPRLAEELGVSERTVRRYVTTLQELGIPVEAELTGQMIYIVNTDAPGFIGGLGTKLGENGINIATFNLGRRREKGEAVALVAVDDPITPEVARQLHDLPAVIEVVPLSF